MDGDGKAEVYIRIANNFTFGDGYTFTNDNDDEQWIASVDGLTGKLLQKSKIPDYFIQYGPMSPQFGVGFLNYHKPSLIVAMKNSLGRLFLH
ncbi:FG-GAP repeat family [Trichomonas vaginalis G3]|uniref:FG-GAP repeat family n=1 Tax=Trichomonas vaginalis (strain ATCC PRA-98 / G3) TaxID=412133 RepID=UPI0021E53C4B|nr:FG-GAP repeat family [Trichomonas vaginalis G3]KAI5531360.1 FG-GAP repeat family [Trichomonas vaginalis G3]